MKFVLDKKYNHLEVEKDKYENWKQRDILQVVIYLKSHIVL